MNKDRLRIIEEEKKYKKEIEQKEKELNEKKVIILNFERDNLNLKKNIEEKYEEIQRTIEEKNKYDKLLEENKTKLKNLEKEEKNNKNKIDECKIKIDEYKDFLTRSQKVILNRVNLDEQKRKINNKMEKQKNEFIIAKEEYEKILKEKYEKELEDQIIKISKMLNQRFEIKKNEIKNSYEQAYKAKEKEMENKFNVMVDSMNSKLEENNNNNNNINLSSICNTIHHGIKCQKCFKEPIVGYRYKCSECNDYDLCQDCEEENFIKGDHPHDFIKIRNEQINENKKSFVNNNNNNIFINNDIPYNNQFQKNIQNNNSFNNNIQNNNNSFNNNNIQNNNIYNNNNNIQNINKSFKKNNIQNNNNSFNNKNIQNNKNEFNIMNNNNNDNEEKDYSYECLNKDSLKQVVEEGEEEVNFELTLKNNKIKKWPQGNAKIVSDSSSNFVGDDIILEPQDYNEIKNYSYKVKDLGSYPIGNYKIYLCFEVNGEQYGDKLLLKIEIKEKQEGDIKEKIKEFREQYSLSKEDFSDNQISEIIQKYNFDYSKAFSALFP